MSSKRTDLTVDRRAWVIVTRGSRVVWQCVDPGQTLSTTGDVATYQRRNQAIEAMRVALSDPQWEPPEDPPHDVQRESEWTVRQIIAGLEDALDNLILDALEDGNG